MPDKFQVFHGVAVEDKADGAREVKVFVRDLTPFAAGKLEDTTRNETYSVKSDGGSASGTVSTTNNVVADYFGGTTNRTHPPDIVKGEQLIITKYADEDKYYWQPAGRDDNLRGPEIIRFAASNAPSGQKELTENNTYFVEIDTKHSKRIRLHTSKSSGEAFGYDLIIDATNNILQVMDDTGNRFEIESKEKRVKLANADGTVVTLDKKDLLLAGIDNVVIRAGKLLTVAAPQIIRQGSIQSTGDTMNTGNIVNEGDVQNSGTITNDGTINSTGNMTAPVFVGNLQGSDGD